MIQDGQLNFDADCRKNSAIPLFIIFKAVQESDGYDADRIFLFRESPFR